MSRSARQIVSLLPRSALRGKRVISLSHILLHARRWQFTSWPTSCAMFGNGEYTVESFYVQGGPRLISSQNAMPALTASTSFVDGDAAGRLPTRGEPSAQATFRGSESDDRGKVANVPAPRPPIGAAAREKILAPNSIRSEPRGGSPSDSVAKSGCYIASNGERSTPSWPSTPKSKS